MKKRMATIIGLGSISAVHIAALLDGDFADIAAVCDVLPERIEQAKKAIPYEVAAYTDYKVMLAEVRPDVVHICTPHYLHAPMCIDALDAGCDVYLEKPAAMDYEEGLAILDAEKATGHKVCVSFQNRVIPTNLTAKTIIDSGEMGAFRGARGFMTWNRSGAYYTESPWRGRWATEGGGVLMNQSIHTLDLLHYLGGKVDHVVGSASLRKNGDIIEEEDTAEATLFYENGATAVFYATNCNVIDASVMVEVYLEKGRLLLQDSKLYRDDGDGYRVIVDDAKEVKVGKAVWGLGHAVMMARFYKALDGEDVSYCTVEEGLRTLKAIGEIYATGAHVKRPRRG